MKEQDKKGASGSSCGKPKRASQYLNGAGVNVSSQFYLVSCGGTGNAALFCSIQAHFVPFIPPQVYETIVKYLGPHGPDALLAFVIFAGVFTAISLGVDPYLASGFGILIYALYCSRRTAAERHAERMAEVEISKTELALSRYREGQLAKLAKEKAKALSGPQTGKGDSK